MPNKTVWLLAAAAVFPAGPALAQDAGAGSDEDVIVVTGRGLEETPATLPVTMPSTTLSQ